MRRLFAKNATHCHEFFLTARSGQTLPDFTDSGSPLGFLAAGVRYLKTASHGPLEQGKSTNE